MSGHSSGHGWRLAHADSHAARGTGHVTGLAREEREEAEPGALAPGAARAIGAGCRALEEEPDPWMTCYEVDVERVLQQSAAFRRLAGKAQVFVFPTDHQRTRLTHALEVAHIARRVARACRLNEPLAEAIALGHDCGHGPGGHASEPALSEYWPGGFDHATFGADVTLAPLNLCQETLDGIRNHSWSRPAPSTPEGEVVSWADRIAYLCHDFEDACSAGLLNPGNLPELVAAKCGTTRVSQLTAFVNDLVASTLETGRVSMHEDFAGALAAFRESNHRLIYRREASVEQARAVASVVRYLVESYAEAPQRMPASSGGSQAGGGAIEAAVCYVAGMTDRFAFEAAARLRDEMLGGRGSAKGERGPAGDAQWTVSSDL
ncbi:MAG: HD domain-containing protein [Acidimicrobiales bacterium]